MVKHYVYVIELDRDNFDPPSSFRKQNEHIWGEGGSGVGENTQFFYVGESAHSPECRYQQHKECHGDEIKFTCICGMECTCHEGPHEIKKDMSNSYVREHGQWLRWRKFNKYNPLESRNEGKRAEKKLALEIRKQGHAAYFA